MRKSGLLSLPLVVLSVACFAGLSRAQDLRINLCKKDQYATRRMQVLVKSGETMNDVVKIRSFDAQSNSFVLEQLTGGTVNLPASDLKKIKFEQEVLQNQSAAQEPIAKIKATPGATFRYTLSQKALKIEGGYLILSESAPRTRISEPAAEAVNTSGDKVRVVDSAPATEARSLTYDPATKSFLVEIQDIKYTKEISGSSGASGVVK